VELSAEAGARLGSEAGPRRGAEERTVPIKVLLDWVIRILAGMIFSVVLSVV